MRNVLLVAAREYKQIASTRGFWVMLLVLPVVIGITQVAGRFFRPDMNSAYVLVDQSGQYEAAIDRRLQLNYQRAELGAFSAYVQRWELGGVRRDAVWSNGDRWFTDAQVEQFIADGGINAAVELIKPHAPPEAPPYIIDPPGYVRAPLPEGVSAATSQALGESLADYLEDQIDTPEGKRPLSLAVFIPSEITAASPVQMWTNGAPNSTLVDNVRNEIARIQRTRAMEAGGFSPEAANAISNISTPIELNAPPQGAGREQVAIRSALPLAMVYLLLVTVMTTGSMMLQGVIEEKSNKLLESILASIRPSDLMYGKLLGLGAIGLTILGVWVGAAVGAALSVQGVVADVVKPSLAALDQPWMIFAMLFYFLAGYLIISMLYLAIGALSNSLQDAQSYLMPVIMIIMLPVIFMMLSVVQQPNGVFPIIMSWIPLYTPFAMLSRLGAGVEMLEVLGTGLMLAAFVVVEMIVLGRLFQASLLRTGQPPKLGGFLAMMMGRNTG